MAYSANVTITFDGPRLVVLVEETEASASTEKAITGLPVSGRVLIQSADKISGGSATIDPVLTTASGSTLSIETVIENGDAAATISNLAEPHIPYYSATGTLWHRSKCSGADTDNTVKTVYLIVPGWGE